MKLVTKMILSVATLLGASLSNVLAADSQMLTNWMTTNSGAYARVYKTTTAESNGTKSTTWTGQDSPVYSDIQVVQYSANWVYVQYSGLSSHMMGPWLNPQGGQFQFWPTNQHGIRRFPRNPVVQSGTKDSTSGGYSGLFVNGVAIFNSLDGQAWDGSQIQGQAPHTQSTYYWHRNAPVAEAFNFDAALGHQPPSAVYHTHQNPLALRYQLGDHVDYSSSTKDYTESVTAMTKHSPIIGWAHDGYPIYGPYGYSSASNSAGGIRRMVPGYVKRDGSNGSDAVTSNRSVIPAWYARYRQAHFGGGYSTAAGASRPSDTSTYPVGTFAQDWAYLGDLGKTKGVDFDLDEYNGRLCYTPEYPNGTYAYFTAIDSSSNSSYPYLLAFEFYGDATGASVANISESVTTQFVGGPNTALVLNTPSVNDDTSLVTLTWSSVEGGTYQVESSPNQSTWTTQSASVSSGGTSTQSSYTGTTGTGYARVTRTALASYDSATTGTFTSTQTDTESYTIGAFSISADPQSQTVNPNANVTFSVTVSGTGPFTYLWYKGVDSIPTATSSSYTINGVTSANAGTYKVVVTKGAVSVTSGNAVLSVNTAPSITQDPQSLTISEGNNATFTVTASGTSPLSYQWKKGSSVINNATNSSYTITNATTASAGTYSVVVTNIVSSVTSGSATLTVTAPVNTAPTITTEPVSQAVAEGGSVTFTVAATGTSPFTYQWKQNNNPIGGATSSSYTINPVYSTNAGTYTVTVSNGTGSDISAGAVLTVISASSSDALLTSWFTNLTGRYARIYETDATRLDGETVTTWGNGAQNQTSPAYAGVQEVFSSSNWVYIRTTGLGMHTMGPWYDNAARSTIFVNMPKNQNAIYRFPRVPTVPGTKVTTGGEIGYMVDGVNLFDARDAVSYSNSNSRDGDAPGSPNGVTGDGIWNRDAYVNESITFDPAYAHQQNTGVYHYHASPIGLRYMLGDHVDFNESTKIYTEKSGSPSKHSPIIAWAKDGHPIYGPYGYSTATDTNSGVRRMVSGFVLRDGQNGTANLSSTGRNTLPLWAQRSQNRTTLTSGQYGPAVSTSFPLGRYAEDNDYLGDLGRTQGTHFDLDEYNGRFCKTPEFPNGTYAYFSCLSSTGAPAYPYNVGRQYYGSPTGGSVSTVSETVVTNWAGGASRTLTVYPPEIDAEGVYLVWTAVEGGTYQIESSFNLTNWTTVDETVVEGVSDGPVVWDYATEFGPDNTFFRIKRTDLAAYDNAGSGTTGGGTGGSGGITSVSPTSAAASSTVTVTITLDANANPALPPTQAVPSAVTIGGVSGISIQRTSTNTVTASFTFGAAASTNTVTVTFTNPMDSSTVSYTLTNGFTVTTAGGGGGGVVTFTATFPTNPPLPPQDQIQASAVGTATATITSYNQATGAVTFQFNNSTLATGNHSATMKFTPPSQSQQTLTSSNQYTKN
ncbi:MAG TPA: YHYH protein [Verrucomicrobiae bacterium]